MPDVNKTDAERAYDQRELWQMIYAQNSNFPIHSVGVTDYSVHINFVDGSFLRIRARDLSGLEVVEPS